MLSGGRELMKVQGTVFRTNMSVMFDGSLTYIIIQTRDVSDSHGQFH